MKYISVLGLLFLVSCGASPSQSGGGVSAAAAAPPEVSVPTTIPAAALHDPQFVVACPDNVLGVPEVLLFSGGHFVLVTATGGGGVSYSSRPVGNYTTQDSRNCNYDINADGSITSN